MNIRPFTKKDADQLITLTRETIKICYGPFLGEAAVDGYIGSGAVEAYFQTPQSDIYVVCDDDGTVLGCGATKENMVDIMMVTHKKLRDGLGTLILEYLEQKIFEDYEIAVLESFQNNDRANAFYKNHGWHVLREYEDKDHNIPMLWMEKSR